RGILGTAVACPGGKGGSGIPAMNFFASALGQNIYERVGRSGRGLQNVLRVEGPPQFYPQTDRTMARFTPALIGFVVVMMVISAGLGVILARVLVVDLMNRYLATTPGGINAVTVASMSAGTNTTRVVAVQTVRVDRAGQALMSHLAVYRLAEA
ncbi:AbrB family transcriptional regulator, partial [Deinococcus ruber]|uniref:AbrB family transcriptional regulator n=1 Tax=Deinococcus ruber TaxID=1848197 RepID=UPI001E3D25EC